MNPRRKKRLVLATTIFAGIAIVIGLVVYALRTEGDWFYVPSEVIHGSKKSGKKPSVGDRIRIGGMVVPGTVSRNDETLEVSFDLVDTGPTVTVVYQGILPDLFREGQGIVADGVLVAADKLQATQVLAKHDENYIPKDMAEGMKSYGYKDANTKESPNSP